jgi:predicted KAP-like P-loop ATPase
MSKSFNDSPIEAPESDAFGFDPFSKSLALSIQKLASPKGTVIAINGPWGSGKSSAVNLVLHHLKPAIDAGDIGVVNFTCWWFKGEDALAAAFFQELSIALRPVIPAEIRTSLRKLGARLLKSSSIVTPVVDALTSGVASQAMVGVAEVLGEVLDIDESIESQHRKLALALGQQTQRFLIVIDDIDRLSPDEALLMFRLIKSVGRLPNVIYLLAYDRELAERIVQERFPSEGPHYLEKIVQAAFELPSSLPTDLGNALFSEFQNTCGVIPEDKVVRFMNIYYDLIVPALRTPRDVRRIANAISISWPPVDLTDFLHQSDC